jgi:hypothetical protein
MEPSPRTPSSFLESFPKRSRSRSEASQFGGSHWYNQNNQTTLLHR